MPFQRAPLAPTEVCLVQMPYSVVERPSIALSILKAVLKKAEISTSILYANLLFAEEVGISNQVWLSASLSQYLCGEWTFANAAFPDYEPDEAGYFEHAAPGLRPLENHLAGRLNGASFTPILRDLRKLAPAFVTRVAEHVLTGKPKIVGCTSLFQQHCASLALLRKIKELAPHVITVIGGGNCESTMGVATHEECSWIDYVASGESEDIFLELCQKLLKRQTHSQKGLSPRSLLVQHSALPAGIIGPEHRKQGRAAYEALYKDPPRARLEDMSRSPAPDYDDFFEQVASSPIGNYIQPGVMVETSRGCWWGEVSHCTFCGLNGGSMGYRAKPADLVMTELQALSARYGIRSFEVVDNILDLDYFKTLLPALVRAKLGYQFFYETKANLSKTHIRLMAESGIKFVQPGIESFDDDVLKLMGKGTTIKKNVQMMKWSLAYGIRVIYSILFEFPGETDAAYATMAKWLPLISHLEAPGALAPIMFERFSPYHMRPAEYGLTISPNHSYAYVYPWKKESLEHFAYFFDDYSLERDLTYGIGESKRPGIRALRRVLGDWKASWARFGKPDAQGNGPDTLFLRREEDQLLITDTRACRVGAAFALDGLAARIYDTCDQARTQSGLLKELTPAGANAPDWAEVEPILSRLVADKLMLHLGDWYFSLAVELTPHGLAPRQRFPGGFLRTEVEARTFELEKQAELLLADW